MHHNLILSFPVKRTDLQDLPSDFYDDEIEEDADHSSQFCGGLCPAHGEFVTIEFMLTSGCDDVSGEFVAQRFIEFMKATPDKLVWNVDS